jgi:ABC-type phosphate/phosphonate transport system substrate-binding protein
VPTSAPRPLRLLTYLAPSVPLAFFEVLAKLLEGALGCPTTLSQETATSGPPKGQRDPFSAGLADVGFVCSPAFLWMRDQSSPSVELVPAAPVIADPRANGRPVYFSDVVVRRDSPARSLSALRGRSWAYNDACSLSGYFSLLRELARRGESTRFFSELRCSGSHLDSLELVASGAVDAAAIDSSVLLLAARRGLARDLRVIESWGPFPIQPVVARATLPAALRARIADALLALGRDPTARAALAEHGVEGFAPVTTADYERERAALRACEPLARAERAAAAVF